MKVDEARKKFEEKGFNEETIILLLRAIHDCVKLLGKYISSDELVERICNNLDKDIEFDDLENTDAIGKFNTEEKKIILHKKLKQFPDLMEETFFHEFLHCITFFYDERNEQEFVGFRVKDFDGYVMGNGINEGMTQYLTKKRNELRGIENKKMGYPLLTMEVENMLSLTDESQIIECYINNPEKIYSLLKEKNIDFSNILIPMDTIYENEKIIFMEKFNKMNETERIFNALFGISKEKQLYKDNGDSMSLLNSELMKLIGEIDSIDKFNKLTDFIEKINEQGLPIDKYNVYHYLLINTKKLINEHGFNQNEIYKIIEEKGLKEFFDIQEKFESLITEDKNLTLKRIINEMYDEYDCIIDIIEEEPSYVSMLKDYFWIGQNDYINMDEKEEEKEEFLDFLRDEDSNFIDYLKTIESFLELCPEYDFDEISSKSFFAEDEEYSFYSIIETSDGKKFVFYDDVDIEETTDEKIADLDKDYVRYDEYHSNLQMAENKLMRKIETLQKYERLNVPNSMIEEQRAIVQEQQELINKMKDRINKRRGERGKNEGDPFSRD